MALYLVFPLLCIHFTVFKDVNTPERFMDDFPNDDGEAAAYAQPNHVYMDCVTFGLGCSCIQVREDSQIDFFLSNVLWAFREGVLPCDVSPTSKKYRFLPLLES